MGCRGLIGGLSWVSRREVKKKRAERRGVARYIGVLVFLGIFFRMG